MADLLQELEEEAQRQRWRDFMRRYGYFFLGGALVALLLVGSWLLWNQQRSQAQAARGDALLLALSAVEFGDVEAAQAALSTLDSGSGLAGLLNGWVQEQGDTNVGGDLTSQQVASLATHIRALMAGEAADFSAGSETPLGRAEAFYAALSLVETGAPGAGAAMRAIQNDAEQAPAYRLVATILLESLALGAGPEEN